MGWRVPKLDSNICTLIYLLIMLKFSIVLAVYKNDSPIFLDHALASITTTQTRQPDEIIIVIDGPIGKDLHSVINQYYNSKSNLYKIITLPENRGLGNALKIGVKEAKYSIIARMDADDISLPDRFKKQVEYIEAHPDCDLLGGQITEFIGTETNIVGRREVPCTKKEIYRWLKKRCPFNHMTVMFKRSSVLAAGNYMDWHYNEDYYLWIRMAEIGCKFANLPDTLVNVRVGKDMYARRGGWRYFKSEKGIQDYMYKRNLISLPRYIFNVFVRFGVQVVMPNSIRAFIFQKLFRK